MKKHNLIFLAAGAICISLTAFGFINMSDNAVEEKVISKECTAAPIEQSQVVSACKSSAKASKGESKEAIAEIKKKAKAIATAEKIGRLEDDLTVSLTQGIWGQPSNVDFEYRVSSRFVYSKDKHELVAAKSVTDLIELLRMHQVQNFWNIEISQFSEDGKEVFKAKGEDDILTEAQKELLTSLDYTSDIFINGDYLRKYQNGVFSEDTLVYHLSISPTTWAAYSDGEEAMISYLKENTTNEVAAVRAKKLKSGMIQFVISKEGTVGPVGILSTSGYAKIDSKFVTLIEQMPAQWVPAKNELGENVEQKMVFYYGMMGC
jgi:hypothetical protein